MSCIQYFRRFSLFDVCVLVYFVIIALAGFAGVWNAHNVEDVTSLVFPGSMLATGFGGTVASIFRSKNGELVSIIMLAVQTMIQPGLLIESDMQTALRLAAAPLMMIPFALMRRGFTIPKREVDIIKTRLREEKSE